MRESLTSRDRKAGADPTLSWVAGSRQEGRGMATIAETARSHQATGTGLSPARDRSDRVPDESLASIIALEVVPRLLVAHGLNAPSPPLIGAEPAIGPDEIAAFAPLALESDADGLLERVEQMLARGVAIDAVMVEVIAPAARTLGLWWEEDRCDFVEVTMGLWRLQEVVRALAERMMPPAAPSHAARHRALFAPFPGDQHDFSALMASDLFRQSGWEADVASGETMSALLAMVGRGRYDVVGLTVSCDCHSAHLPSAVLALRSVSLNPKVRVMVGGPVLKEDPGLALRAGADGTAADARGALALAEYLVGVTADGAIGAN